MDIKIESSLRDRVHPPEWDLIPPELKLLGFDLNASKIEISGGIAICRIPHCEMPKVKALFKRFNSQEACSSISDIRFGSYFKNRYNEDGSISASPRTMRIDGKEYLESYMEIEYPYPIVTLNPAD